VVPTSRDGDTTVSGKASPEACPPKHDIDFEIMRLCHIDADCSAGGITTNQATCCPSSVLNHAAGACKAACGPR
jgi:hypothetical protein